jgi:hypothetical protein
MHSVNSSGFCREIIQSIVAGLAGFAEIDQVHGLVRIHRRGVDVGDLQVKLPLAGGDFADFREQVFVLLLAQEGAVFQPLLVQHIAANGKVAQDAGGPLPELDGAGRVHAKANGDDGVQVVESGEVLFAFGGSCSEFPNN